MPRFTLAFLLPQFCCLFFYITVSAIEISDIPLEIQAKAAPPNLIFILDNSASMDWEFMTTEDSGQFNGQYYLFADDAYIPRHDHHFGDNHALNPSQRKLWRSQWAGYNRVFYNPYTLYSPWPATSKYDLGSADLNRPWSKPVQAAANNARLHLADIFFTVQSASGTITIANAHYFTIHDMDGDGKHDSGEAVYLVTWQDSNNDNQLDWTNDSTNDRRFYYRLEDDGDGQVEDNELVLVTAEAEKNCIRPALYEKSGRFVRYKTDREDLQNFANWVSYYRRRGLVAKAVVAHAIAGLKQMQVGLYAINREPRVAVQPVKIGQGQDKTSYLLNRLYTMDVGGVTPLRSALDQVGRYYHQDMMSSLGHSPYWSEKSGGSCQRSHAIVITDGFYNGAFSGLGNVDGSKGTPYADNWENTLADIAMYYYETDLAPDMADQLPSRGCDEARHQHMTTYTLSFGLKGLLNVNDIDNDGSPDKPGYRQDPCFNDSRALKPIWPDPKGNTASKIDDLWHAAVNGRGLYFDAQDPQVLRDAVDQMLDHINSTGSASSVAVNSTELTASSMIYQAQYESLDWTGELLAYSLNSIQEGGKELLWKASEGLNHLGENADSRRIVTYGGPWQEAAGVPFQYDLLSSTQKASLGWDGRSGSAAEDRARKVVAYLRGDTVDGLRLRQGKLGDIVHSVPVVSGQTVYVGANDGMLHAFNAQTGDERFAYVPGLVFDHLTNLADPDYARHHRYYVDGMLYIGEVLTGDFHRKTFLVGGLGKGGKGYYCLCIRSRERPQKGDAYGNYEEKFSADHITWEAYENIVSKMVQWEYPRPDTADDNMDNDADGLVDEAQEVDPDMGYSFSRAFAVNANTTEESYRPVVIFGNGYNSALGNAVLYILDAQSGTIVRKIDTGAGGDNGLSTPALIDTDLDRCIDYAYAGDLKGNLWKFDLTSPIPSQWAVAYGVDANCDGVINVADGDQPLPIFQAPGQSITSRPDVMRMKSLCAAEAPGFMVIFGTGKYLGAKDIYDTSQQSIYGIWDYGDDSDDSEYLGSLTNRTSGHLLSGLFLVRRTITSQTIKEGVVYRVLSDEDIEYDLVADEADKDECNRNNYGRVQDKDPERLAGWFLDFPMLPNQFAEPGERVTSRVVLRGGKAVVVSFAPTNEPCMTGGSSWVYLLGGCSGKAPKDETGAPQLPCRFEAKINDNIVIVKEQSQRQHDLMIMGDHLGRIMTKAFLGEYWGRVYWRQNE